MLPQQIYQQNEYSNCNASGSGNNNSQMCSENRTNDTNNNCKDVQNASPPFRDLNMHLNSGKSSQLKETHSALVKILESAPINHNIKSNKINDSKTSSNTMSTMKLITKAAAKATTTSTTTSSINPQLPTTNDTINLVENLPSSKSQTPLLVNQWINQQNINSNKNIINNSNIDKQQHHHFYHRKRNKHLIDNMHCDMDKSSDEEIGCNSNSSASSNASEAEIICPWKKTRIAREWHQSQKTNDNDITMNEQIIIDDNQQQSKKHSNEQEQEQQQQIETLSCNNNMATNNAINDTINLLTLEQATKTNINNTVIIAQNTTETSSLMNQAFNHIHNSYHTRFNYAHHNYDGDYDAGDDISDDNG